MRKPILITCFILMALVNYKTSIGQTPQQNLDKYWHYRYRLVQYFEKVGMKQGMSIPATVRNGPTNNNAKTENQIYWEDSPQCLGYYIGVLATEYQLLSSNNQDVSETMKELYYALHAVYRLDSMGYFYYSQAIFPFPGQGYMIRDDIASTWVSTYQTDVNLGINASSNSWVPGSGQPIYLDPAQNTLSDYQIGGGAMDAGVDTYSALLLGLDMVMAFVPDVNFSWTESSGPNTLNFSIGPGTGSYPFSPNAGESATIRQMAKDLGTAILEYMATTNNVAEPVTWAPNTYFAELVKYLFGIGSVTVNLSNVPWGLVEPNGATVSDNQGGWPSSSVFSTPLSSQASAWYGVSITPSNIGNDIWGPIVASCNASLAPYIGLPINVAGMQSDNTNNNIACYNAAATNLGASTGYSFPPYYYDAFDLLNFLGNGSFCGGNNNYWGRDVFYTGILMAIYSNNYAPGSWNFCSATEMLNSAPWDGPYNHGSGDLAPDGWASPRRFIDAGGDGHPGIFNGNYNGLDYMLLFNIYSILTEELTTTYATIVPTTPQIGNIYAPSDGRYVPLDYPFYVLVDSKIGITEEGTSTNPYIISSSYCGFNVAVNSMNVTSTGGIGMYAGSDGVVALNPLPGPISVANGGYCFIGTNNNCCTPTINYFNEFTSSQSQTLRKAGGGDSIPPYNKSTEFDTLNSFDGIHCYPSPFTQETNVVFNLKSDSPVSIYVTDMSGKIVGTLVNNEGYTKGSHMLTFNGSALAAGTYLGVLVTKEGKRTIKMVKTK